MLRRRWVMIGSMAATVASGLMASAAPVQDDTEKQLAFRYLNSGDAQDLKQDQEVARQEAKQNQVDIEVTATEAGDAAEVPTDAHLTNYFLGIRLKSITGDLANYLDSRDGILVDAVLPDSPAEASKLQVGDILLAIDDKGLAGPPSLWRHAVGSQRRRGQRCSPEPESTAQRQNAGHSNYTCHPPRIAAGEGYRD